MENRTRCYKVLCTFFKIDFCSIAVSFSHELRAWKPISWAVSIDRIPLGHKCATISPPTLTMKKNAGRGFALLFDIIQSTPPILISFLSLQYPKWILIDGIGDDIGLKLHEMYTHTQQSITSETFFCFLSSVPGQTVTPPPPLFKIKKRTMGNNIQAWKASGNDLADM